MCGITGMAGFDDESLLHRMCSSLTHRGPDEDGFFTAPGVGLAMRRLSVIDLQTGRQPIANEDRTIWVVFNGEVYNYQELTQQLQERGHVFTTRSDTETIVHLYEEYGLDFVEHLRGMFAIALWDCIRQRLVLVRDRIGEKPLYYQAAAGRLIFGSEIKALLQSGVVREVDAQAVSEFLAAGYVPAPHTFFRGIRKLPPGWMLIWEEGRASARPYWQHDFRQTSVLSFEAAAAALTSRLRETIALCLKSDVEVGAFLSGGIDSSLIVALMAEHGAHIQTFTVGYRGAARGFNELAEAARVAQHVGTRHHELIIEPTANLDLFPQVLWHFDEPLGEPTAVLVHILCRFARERVKVVLGGTGGDELFFGYPRHAGIRMLQAYRRLPRLLRRGVIEPLVQRWPESTRGSRLAKRARRLVSGSDLASTDAYRHWVQLVQPDVRERLLGDEMAAAAPEPAGDGFMQAVLRGHAGELLTRAAELDVRYYLPEFQLTYMDRMSMAHGLEVRSPLCDYRLAEFVLSLPPSYRLKGTRSKHILKHVARAWLPRATIERQKVGFDSPVGQWFKDELREFLLRFLAREQVAQSGLLKPAGVQQILADHLAGRRDYSLQLWSMLMLEAWHRMYIEDQITDGSDYRLQDLRGAVARSAVSQHSRASEVMNAEDVWP